ASVPACPAPRRKPKSAAKTIRRERRRSHERFAPLPSWLMILFLHERTPFVARAAAEVQWNFFMAARGNGRTEPDRAAERLTSTCSRATAGDRHGEDRAQGCMAAAGFTDRQEGTAQGQCEIQAQHARAVVTRRRAAAQAACQGQHADRRDQPE